MLKYAHMDRLNLAPLWKAMADPKRRRIILLLGEKARTTGELCAFFDVSRYAIMRHLRVLEQAGFTRSRREGRQRWNYLNEELLREIQATYIQDSANGDLQLNKVLTYLTAQEIVWPNDGSVPERKPIELEATLEATPDQVFRALTEDIDHWWNTRIKSDSRVYLEANIGGRFYEAFSDGGGVLYALVTQLKPGEQIRLNGSMGQDDEGVNNIIQINLREYQTNSTHLHLTQRTYGELNTANTDTVSHLMQDLKSFVEVGTTYQAPSDCGET